MTTHKYPPIIHEKFDKWEDATRFLRETVDRCADDGYWFREVELSHENNFDTKRGVIHVYVRRLPKIVAQIKAENLVLENVSFRRRLPTLGDA